MSDWLPRSCADRQRSPSPQSASLFLRLQRSPSPCWLHPGDPRTNRRDVASVVSVREIKARAFTGASLPETERPAYSAASPLFLVKLFSFLPAPFSRFTCFSFFASMASIKRPMYVAALVSEKKSDA